MERTGESSSQTETVTQQAAPQLHLRLRQPTAEDEARAVSWAAGVVDNEGMGKKKSKCCCVYHKKREFGESDDSDSDCETDHCSGHKERRSKS